MALAAATVWEVRTTGADTNGGGFVAGASGTDFSQQDAAQFALTGVTTAGTGATFLTATAAASMVGNILNVVSGTNFVVGRFRILSVSVGVSVTVDRNICTGAGASGVINIGGALATIGVASTSYVGSNKIFVKASGNYTITASPTFAATVSLGYVVPYSCLIGYSSVRGDAGRPTIVLSTNTGLTGIKVTGDGHQIENFVIDCTGLGTSTGISSSGIDCNVINCKVSNFTLNGIAVAGETQVTDCEITGGTSAATTGALLLNGIIHGVYRNYIHDNACPGICASQRINIIEFNLVCNNTGASSDGIQISYDNLICNNTIFGNGRHGISGQDQYEGILCQIKNNILVNNGGYGIQLYSSAGWAANRSWDGNAYYNNTSGTRNNMDDTTVNPQDGVAPYTNVFDKVLSGSPFTNAAGGDFTLNNTAEAGASCRAGGTPGALPGISQLGYIDMGALQHQDSPSIISVSSITPVIVNRFGVSGY